nr:aryl-sulfate sulfotransferase [Secundilactobacillus oryzae]
MLKTKKIWTIFALPILALTLVLVLAGCASEKHSAAVIKDASTKAGVLTAKQVKSNINGHTVTTREDSQKSLNATYPKAVANDDYTFDNPYVKVNPYETSPLSALIIFHTDKAVKVNYTVEGKTDKTSITNSVKGYKKTHQIPVVGLYSGTNTVSVTTTDKNGKKETEAYTVTTTTSLPKYIENSNPTATNVDKSKMIIGKNELTVLVRSTKETYTVDADGAVRWYSTLWNQHIMEPLSTGHFLMLTKENTSDLVYNDLIQTDYLGRVYKEYKFGTKTVSNEFGTKNAETTIIHHDITELPNHHYLATVNDGSSKYVEDTIVEISHKTGKVVRVLNLKNILPASMYKNYSATKRGDGRLDWFHNNAVDYIKKDHSILVSGRNSDMTMKIDWNTQKIQWIYSGKKKSSWPKATRSMC